jgi:hypothetical protein
MADKGVGGTVRLFGRHSVIGEDWQQRLSLSLAQFDAPLTAIKPFGRPGISVAAAAADCA